jgi:hypothetical protein
MLPLILVKPIQWHLLAALHFQQQRPQTLCLEASSLQIPRKPLGMERIQFQVEEIQFHPQHYLGAVRFQGFEPFCQPSLDPAPASCHVLIGWYLFPVKAKIVITFEQS